MIKAIRNFTEICLAILYGYIAYKGVYSISTTETVFEEVVLMGATVINCAISLTVFKRWWKND